MLPEGQSRPAVEPKKEEVTLDTFPIRNVLCVQMVKADQQADPDDPKVIERRKWRVLACRVEKIVVIVYSLAILVTPLFMFYFAPMIFDAADRARLENFKE